MPHIQILISKAGHIAHLKVGIDKDHEIPLPSLSPDDLLELDMAEWLAKAREDRS
jgi:hypothetical protein